MKLLDKHTRRNLLFSFCIKLQKKEKKKLMKKFMEFMHEYIL